MRRILFGRADALVAGNEVKAAVKVKSFEGTANLRDTSKLTTRNSGRFGALLLDLDGIKTTLRRNTKPVYAAE